MERTKRIFIQHKKITSLNDTRSYFLFLDFTVCTVDILEFFGLNRQSLMQLMQV